VKYPNLIEMKSPQPSLARRELVMKSRTDETDEHRYCFQKIEITSLTTSLRLPVELAMMQS